MSLVLLMAVAALVALTVAAQNPASGFKVPWVDDQVDDQGRPAKGRLNISNYLKERRM